MPPFPTAPGTTELSDWSLRDPHGFWAEQAKAIHWQDPYNQIFDLSRPPFSKWFPGGTTNLCYNALDRHLAQRGEQIAIVYLSTETGEERKLTYRELHREVLRMAALFRSLGLAKGDRVALYLPVIPEAAIAMLACARLGLIHSVVFAGFAAESLARRIQDADARLVVTCDATLRNGKLIRLKRTVDEAIAIAQSAARILVINRGLDCEAGFDPARDIENADWSGAGETVPCVWLESSEPSYVLYTSGTTAQPKGVQRDVGGYAVALAASMRHIFGCEPGETYFSTADVGWVVGHSYSVYGPLIHGMTTVLFEGLPIHQNGEIWWNIVEQTRASVMFSSPTAIRILKKCESAVIKKYDLSSLRRLFLAGEPLDQPTSSWAAKVLGHVQIADNYWQTETGWPILSQTPGCGRVAPKAGSPGVPVYGYDVYLADEHTGEPLPRGRRGVIALRLPLPPGCFSTVWKQDALFESHYFWQFPGKQVYSTFDYAVQDEDGHYFILGRTDDVINVAGHRIGTREIEETICSHPSVAEAATVGVADELKGQVIKCFVVLKNTEGSQAKIATQIEERIVGKLGSIARPAFVGIVAQLPKTRSGKIMRRAIQAIGEGREPGDLSTLEDPASLSYIREVLGQPKI